MKSFVTIDAGGTNTRIGISTNLVSYENISRFKTPGTLAEFKSKINDILSNVENIQALVLGVAGIIDRVNNQIITAPHITYLNGLKTEEILEKGSIHEQKIYLENDAALAALAESIKGEGKGFSRVAYITISTGVGGSLIIDQKLPRTKFNYEPGHHIINFNGREFAVRNIRGSWESFSSGTAFQNRYGVNPVEHNDRALWEEYGEILAVGLHNIALLWQPDVIILGGSMSKKSFLFLKALKRDLEKTMPFTAPEIRVSTLGDENGLIGGLEHLKNSF